MKSRKLTLIAIAMAILAVWGMSLSCWQLPFA
jgi:hypothetical protein